MSETETPVPAPERTSKTGWKKRAKHEGITLPSGAVVDITLPNLATLVKAGDIPNDLIDDALKQKAEKELTRDDLLKSWDFQKFIIPRLVVNPKITPEDVDELPIEDVEMLSSFATRRADTDAVGHQLGGLETVKSFREHRGIVNIDEVLQHVQ